LRSQIFSDTILRRLGRRFIDSSRPVEVNDFLDVEGIGTENVMKYGKKFAKLLEGYRKQYQDNIVGQDPEDDYEAQDLASPSKHDKNVVNLVSDDEEEMSDEGENSRFWQPSQDVQNFNIFCMSAPAFISSFILTYVQFLSSPRLPLNQPRLRNKAENHSDVLSQLPKEDLGSDASLVDRGNLAVGLELERGCINVTVAADLAVVPQDPRLEGVVMVDAEALG
jgi:hypothetical protein